MFVGVEVTVLVDVKTPVHVLVGVLVNVGVAVGVGVKVSVGVIVGVGVLGFALVGVGLKVAVTRTIGEEGETVMFLVHPTIMAPAEAAAKIINPIHLCAFFIFPSGI